MRTQKLPKQVQELRGGQGGKPGDSTENVKILQKTLKFDGKPEEGDIPHDAEQNPKLEN